ncbi:anhydro-N-acetylmuramic acid kinase [Sphingobacteriales bacterium UPWRP_1]|nr:hypothetical protein BVG80_14325 [Sphingobacteriales bacterium TSM_CSM]PSJ72444.1 anhydro-N-acetylmuramic acid kinase [Sphingobacteriales bacterium UPWRP_1]
MQKYRIIGLMSGTSLDGVDLAYCLFHRVNGQWQYQITCADCLPYSDAWKNRLSNLIHTDIETYLKTDADYGYYLGQLLNEFIHRHHLHGKVDAIASHGQTIIHRPHLGFTAQIGSGAAIAETTHLPVVCNLRANDVAAGGQGAPVVPLTDNYLFAPYLFCLNLGGIANISCKLNNGGIVGYDICPNNLLLNYLSGKLGLPYDAGGQIAASGTPHLPLLEQLNQLPFYSLPFPKSLDADFVPQMVLPLLNRFNLPLPNLLCTCAEHIATQIAQQVELLYQLPVNPNCGRTLFITGGGAFNTYLVQRISALVNAQTLVPNELTVNYKEALAMAFMAVLRLRNEPNCLSSVTGARTNTVSGCIYFAR